MLVDSARMPWKCYFIISAFKTHHLSVGISIFGKFFRIKAILGNNTNSILILNRMNHGCINIYSPELRRHRVIAIERNDKCIWFVFHAALETRQTEARRKIVSYSRSEINSDPRRVFAHIFILNGESLFYLWGW